MKPVILICGQTGTGKSSIVNFRLQKPVARVGNTAESVRNGFPPPRYENKSVIFYDSDGYEIGQSEEYKENLLGFLVETLEKGDLPLVWYTVNAAAHRVTPFDREIVELIEQRLPVGILLTKIDECDEDGLNNFYAEVSEFIPETDVFRVSTVNGEIQKFTDWDALVEWTTEILNRIEIVQQLQKLAEKARSVIENTHLAASLSAAIPIPLLDSAVLIPILSDMVTKILAV
jgi:GTPase Era involved in 16S rRNA processing